MTPRLLDESARLAEVLRLRHIEGLSIRAIARRQGMSRRTIRRLLGKRRPAPPEPPARGSVVDLYEADIRKMLAYTPELKATTVLERLRPLGYTGGITVLRERIRRLRPKPRREAFLTLDFAPGSAFQVDWADFGFALPGCPRRVSAFVMASAYSRYLYLEFTLSQAMATFLRCMERALHFFGGVAVADIFDYVSGHIVEVRCPNRLRARAIVVRLSSRRCLRVPPIAEHITLAFWQGAQPQLRSGCHVGTVLHSTRYSGPLPVILDRPRDRGVRHLAH